MVATLSLPLNEPVVPNDALPVVVSVIGESYVPMIVLPPASLACAVIVVVPATCGYASAGISVIDATAPLSVSGNEFACPETTVPCTVPLESTLPAPSGWSNVFTRNVSLPTLALTLIVHVVAPPLVVQFDEPGVVFCTTAGLGDAVPSVSTMETDFVLAET